jgi:uncharacterized membrane protein (UPF0182 family)
MATPLRRPRSRVPIVIGAVVVLLLILVNFAGFYTDLLWFNEVGFSSVLWTTIRQQLVTGVVVGLFIAALVYVNLWIARRMAPVYAYFASDSREGLDPLDRYRDALGPYLRWIQIGLAGLIGLLAGFTASSQWQTFALYLNRVPFGERDPQFDRDVGFYVFELPFFKIVLGWLWFGLVAALIVALVAHYFYGSIRPQGGLQGLSSGVMAHLSVLLGLLALVKAAQYWLGTFELNFSERGVVTGASYTDVNAQLPALQLLAVVSIISAILFLANIRFRRISLPVAAVGIWILTAVLAGGVWPWWVQRFSVDPQEAQREAPYIQRNIASTRLGFGLADVESVPFPAADNLTTEGVQANQSLLSNVRVWDPDALQRAYSQLQAITPFYAFPDVDIDRYEVDGEMRQVLLAPRELSVEDLNETSRTWTNTHLRYTHGYGLVASLANEATEAGQPEFLVRDLPGTVTADSPELELEQPGVYYGETFDSSEYSIVNSAQSELDYQGESDEIVSSNYAGQGGVDVGNYLTRLAFAVRERDPNILLSQAIRPESRIMIYKDVRDRVSRAAPFLKLDNDPYVAAVDGRLKWILDGFTTSQWYPYSERFDLGSIVPPESAALTGTANYVRNSVKVVVDAYDGTMDFYIIDDEDPIIEAWSNTFPELFTEEQPPEGITSHFRYPEDLLRIQSEVYLTYHISDPINFYGKSDEWAVARISTSTDETVDPTYLLISLPGETEQEFVLSRPFTPRARNNMNALLIARSDPGHYGELLTIDFPSQVQVDGPAQVNNLINQDAAISSRISLLDQRGSNVLFGSLVVLPIEDSVMYIQPLLLEAGSELGGEGIPEIDRVVVVYGERVESGIDLEDALGNLFGLAEQAPPPEEGTTGGGGGAPPTGELGSVVDQAAQVYEDAQQALRDGDFQRYGELIEQLGSLIEQAESLSAGDGGGAGAGGGGGRSGGGGG